MSFVFEPTDIPEVIRVRGTRHGDARGYFTETYRRSAFARGGIDVSFVQDNEARSAGGVVRGLHYQAPPRAQGKLVRAVAGRIWDVAVDLRVGSPTYGRWVAEVLDGSDDLHLWIPPGFAHGYAVLGDGATIAYKVTAEYDPELDRGFAWNDPEIGVAWPIEDPVLSARDRAASPLALADNPFTYP